MKTALHRAALAVAIGLAGGEQVAKYKKSYTGMFLKEELGE